MRIFECGKCGCKIPEKKLLKNIEQMEEKGLITKKTLQKAKREVASEKPYIRCHNPECDGLLREIERESIEINSENRR